MIYGKQMIVDWIKNNKTHHRATISLFNILGYTSFIGGTYGTYGSSSWGVLSSGDYCRGSHYLCGGTIVCGDLRRHNVVIGVFYAK